VPESKRLLMQDVQAVFEPEQVAQGDVHAWHDVPLT
jgi:hypothetical protein